MLKSVQSGVFSRTGNDAVDQILASLSSIVERLGSSSAESIESALNVVNKLNNEERERFDSIISELIRRSLNRLTERLSTVARIA